MTSVIKVAPMNAANFETGAAPDGHVLTANGAGGAEMRAPALLNAGEILAHISIASRSSPITTTILRLSCPPGLYRATVLVTDGLDGDGSGVMVPLLKFDADTITRGFYFADANSGSSITGVYLNADGDHYKSASLLQITNTTSDINYAVQYVAPGTYAMEIVLELLSYLP